MATQKSSVKPHILSWLQRDPAAGVQPFVFTPNLSGKSSKPHRSQLISRACLASTTSDFLLVDSNLRGRNRGILSRISSLIPYRLLVIAIIVCMTWPTQTTTARAVEESEMSQQ